MTKEPVNRDGSAEFADDHYRLLFEAIDVGFCTIEVVFDDGGRPVDYTFLDVNPAFEQQTGLQSAIGRRMRSLAPTHEEHWFQTYGEIAVSGLPRRFEHEAAALGRWYSVYAFRVGEPRVRRVAVLFQDITRQKRAEAALQDSEAAHALARSAAESANRAKDEFLAMLGHELRNPLAPMLTALQVLRMRGSTSKEQEVLERQMTQLSRLVDDLLDVARVTRGTVDLRKSVVELWAVVVRAAETAGPLLEQRQQRLDVHVPPSGLPLHVDSDRMAQVVTNLLTNASKYSPPGSRVVVSATRQGDTIALSIRDEGIGIARDMLDRVFEPFVRDRQIPNALTGGLGLGLTIARALVEAHGGRVRVLSDGQDQGSEFLVEVPALHDTAVDGDERSQIDSPIGSADNAKRILIVDDNRDGAEMLSIALEQMGHTTVVALDGPAAISQAAAFQPQIAILDIGLPVMNGYELASRLRQQHGAEGQPLTLIAVSGYGRDVDRRSSADAGFLDHLVKPVDLAVLKRLLEETAVGRE